MASSAPLIVRLRNALTNQLEEVPHQDKPLTWYSCGPTVYAPAHLGHARTFVHIDLMIRSFRQLGYWVEDAINITDFLGRAADMGIPYLEHARKMESEFWSDMATLGVNFPMHRLCVTEHIPEIIAYVERMVADGYATERSEDGVYFNSRAFHEAGHTLPLHWPTAAANGECKECTADFALWKCKSVGWESPWGKGQPGWHVECSSMSHKTLGPVIDIHAGGCDLRFSHHYNEIAQSKCQAQNEIKRFVHIGHLEIDGRKMGKSEKNFITIQELVSQLPRDVNATNVLRLLFLTTHWSKTLHFTQASVKAAVACDRHLTNWMQNAEREARHHVYAPTAKQTVEQLPVLDDVLTLLQDNVRFDDAFAMYLKFTQKTSPEQVTYHVYKDLRQQMNQFFGLSYEPKVKLSTALTSVVNAVTDHRQALRQLAKETKDPSLFALCDKLRAALAAEGLLLEDSDAYASSAWKVRHE